MSIKMAKNIVESPGEEVYNSVCEIKRIALRAVLLIIGIVGGYICWKLL